MTKQKKDNLITVKLEKRLHKKILLEKVRNGGTVVSILNSIVEEHFEKKK